MSPNELAELIEQLILAQDDKYTKAIIRLQGKLYDEVLSIVKNLDIDDNGYILQSNSNRQILADADAKIYEVFGSALYQNAVSSYVSVIGKLDKSNSEYFSGIDGFKGNKAFLNSIQKQSIATVEKYVLQDGLESQVIAPLSQILNQNINSGGKFSGFLQQVKDYIEGNNNVEGRALSYSRTYLRDAMFTYSRTFQNAISSDLGLEYYLYAGGVTDKSRDFCLERKGNYYHYKEIEKWAALSWQGKKAGTTESSIFLFCGGWNCADSLIPVHQSIVPDDVIERAEKAGYVK